MKKKNEVTTFHSICVGDMFVTPADKSVKGIYIKTHEYCSDEDLDTAINLISGDTHRYFFADKVIPVDVEIKFKEENDVSNKNY